MTMNWVDKFRAARRCSVPIIAIDTPDPAATIRTLCAASNGAPKLQYDLARGYRPLNEEGEQVISDQGLDKVDNPVVAMKAAASVPTGSIIFVHNAHRFFKELAFLQPVWNLRDQFTGNRRMLVLLGPCLELPAEIRGDVIAIDDPLPDREAIRQIVQKVHDDAGVEPSEDSLASAGKALTGLPAFQVEQLTAMNLTPDGIALDGLWDAKAKQIKQTPGLSLHRGGTTFANLGGLGQLKDYFQRLMTGRQAPDVVVWLDEIEKSGLANTGDLSGTNSDQLGTVLSYMEDHKVYGTMLLGLPGTGKSEFCKAVGNEFERVVIRIDMGAMKGSLVGQSEQQLREALKVVSAMGGENAIWIGTSNSMENLDSALQSRFTDVFFFDLPDQEERFAIWNVWCNHYEITNGFGGINDEGWVGRDIKQCCEKAYRMTSPLEEAARFIIPGAVKCREEIERLRSQAHNRYLSVTTPGAYREPTPKT